mmetsp:Transcript_30603/g.41911  ORF Transcript_30603/g.41911 Transcript_30603/m.41911 type:complete len:117 (+) Transcript_30603:65-415(+)
MNTCAKCNYSVAIGTQADINSYAGPCVAIILPFKLQLQLIFNLLWYASLILSIAGKKPKSVTSTASAVAISIRRTLTALHGKIPLNSPVQITTRNVSICQESWNLKDLRKIWLISQ